MLPESSAVVCAPKFNPKYVFALIIYNSSHMNSNLFIFFSFGIFRITDPPGLDVILNCQAKEAFHPHPDQAIYTVSRVICFR
jgi:STAM-binding protein